MGEPLNKKEQVELMKKGPGEVEQPQKWFQYMEIVMCLHLIGIIYTGTMVNDLLLDRACRINLKYESDICDQLQIRNISMLANEEKAAQKYVASVESWNSILENLMMPLSLLVLGSWSDIYGRKFLLTLGLGATLLRYVSLILSTYFAHWNVETVAVLATIPIAITGFMDTTVMALLSYIADTTTIKQKTFRFILANAFINISMSIGSLMYGFLTKKGLNLTQLFVIAATITGFCILYTIFFIPNTRGKKKPIDPLQTKNDPNVEKSEKSLCENLFSFQNVVAALKVPFRKRDGTKRIQLISLLLVTFIFLLAMDYRMMYLYTRFKFQWNREDFSYFVSSTLFLSFLGALVSALILSRKLGMRDPIVGIISCLSQIGGSLFYSFATAGWMMYLGAAIDVVDKIYMSCANSMVFKILDPHEIGKATAVMAIVKSFGKLANGPLASLVYGATLSIFPGTFFVVEAALTVVPLIIFVLLWKFGLRPSPPNVKDGSTLKS